MADLPAIGAGEPSFPRGGSMCLGQKAEMGKYFKGNLLRGVSFSFVCFFFFESIFFLGESIWKRFFKQPKATVLGRSSVSNET